MKADKRGREGHLIVQKVVAIHEKADRTNPKSSPNGNGWREDEAAYTCQTGHPQAVAFQARQSSFGAWEGVSGTIDTGNPPQAVAFAQNQQGHVRLAGGDGEITPSINKPGGAPGQGYIAITDGYVVRKLTPLEVERLFGFPDNYTLVEHRGKPMPKTRRYAILGNSMAVNCMNWLGHRIKLMDEVWSKHGIPIAQKKDEDAPPAQKF